MRRVHPEIAVLLTDSRQNQAALQTAKQLAADRCPVATIVLLRVISPPMQVGLGDGAPLVDLAERQADRDLSALAQTLGQIPTRRVVLVGRQLAKEVGLWLTRHRIEAIVVGGVERRRWRIRSGNTVVTALVQQSSVPVVVAPAIADEGDSAVLDPLAALAEADRILHFGWSRG